MRTATAALVTTMSRPSSLAGSYRVSLPISSQGAAKDCALSLTWSGRAAENAGFLKRQHRSRSQRRFPEDALVANVGCRRNLAIRHGIDEGRQSTPDAVIHVMTPSSMAAAENLPVPWLDAVRQIRSTFSVSELMHESHGTDITRRFFRKSLMSKRQGRELAKKFEEAQTDYKNGSGFDDRRMGLRRGCRRNCSPYRRTIAAAGSSRMPTPPRSST
jgi:hypothetical protein